MLVTHFERLPVPGGYSIERLFREIRRSLPEQFCVEIVRCETPYHSPWWLIKGIARASSRAAGVNHIVGDVHYVALGLPAEQTILTVHDLNRLSSLRGFRRVIYKWLYFSLPLHRCRFVTAISECTRQHLVKLFPFAESKIVVIPDSVPGSFKPSPKKFDIDCPRILQVGTNANKNLERVARALVGVHCDFHIVGPLTREHRNLLTNLHIQYENSVDLSDDDLLQAYEHADMVLFASLTEGFGLPIIEANAIGRPVITSNISPMKEVAGQAGCLVDPFDLADIRRGIRRVIDDDGYREFLVSQGYENASRYTARVVASEYAKLYWAVTQLNRTAHKENAQDRGCQLPR